MKRLIFFLFEEKRLLFVSVSWARVRNHG